MNDLISRKVVIDILKQSGIIVDNVRGNLIIEEINRIPTAYDVDKVVEQLRLSEFDLDEKPHVVLNKVISIVKGAIKDE